MDLFDFNNNEEGAKPLAEKMRAETLDEFIGQKHIVAEGSLLRRAIRTDRLGSCIFWGPPGCGKTTLANIIAKTTRGNFIKLNAVQSGVADVKKAVEDARNALKLYGKRTYLLLDECHRFNKTQSDSLLPAIEQGTILFIGSTTENPYASMTPAIVSRCRVFEFKPLTVSDIEGALRRALADRRRGFGRLSLAVSDEAISHIARMAGGDLRSAYNALELAVLTTVPDGDGKISVTLADAEQSIQRKSLSYNEDTYYDILSAFCKSLRGSDSSAALYYAMRLIEGGCDPMLVARRLVVHSAEDVGMADPRALRMATAAMYALEKIGYPEGLIPLSDAIVYVCEAPKSNAVYTAYNAIRSFVKKDGSRPVPLYIRNAPTKLMKELGYHEGYRYAHDEPGAFAAGEIYLPEGLETIGRSAFSNCTRLKSASFPESLRTLEQGAFSGCTSLESAELPSGLENWGYSAFEDCTGLLSVRVPGTIGTIPGSTFEGCTSLNQVEISEGVTGIGEDAFYSCVGLKKIDLPDSIEQIGSNAFRNCSGLEEFRYPAGWSSAGWNIFQGCTSLKRIDIPEGVERIPDNAFSSAELTEVAFPSTLTEIGEGSFRGNTLLTEICLPDTVKVIDDSAFYGCTSLAVAELPEGLERIGQQAFRDCSGLSAVIVPASVEEAGELCFSDCDSLIIYCYSGTAMHQLCEEEGYDYRLLDDHEHNFTAETIQRPSCISGGTQELTCSVCGYHYREQLEPLGHSWSEWRVESEATIFSDGRKVRECTRCGTEEEIITDRIEVDYTEDSGYGLAHFQVTDAVTLEPVPNASIFVSTEEGEAELAADAEGKLDQVLPVGDVKLAVYADGYQIRNLSITVLPGQNKIPQIGISRNDLVQGKLTASEMTYEEMVEAGVDVNDPGNQHLYKYELVLEFTPNTELLSLAYYIDQEGDPRMIGGAKLTEGGEINLSDKIIEEESGERVGIRYTTDEGETVSVYPVSERFFLIIRGEVHWLKEMYDVELMVINTSMTDTVEKAEAELTLPEGLSLAAMSGEEQSLVQEIGTVGHGESRSVHWYVRGDAEGTYSIAAALRGTMQPFGDTFEYLYEAKDPIKVYAGSAMHLTYHVPDTAYYQEDYTVRIELENVSDKTLYNVSHRITDVQQLRVTTYSDGTVETEEYPVTGGTGEITVEEFRPGEIINIEVTTNIMFQSRLMEYQLANVVEYNPGIAGFLEAFRAFTREAETGDELQKLAEAVYTEAEALREDSSSADAGKAELAGQTASGLQEILSLCGPEPSAAAAITAGQMKTSGLWDELQAIAENPGSLKEYSEKELSALNSRIRAVQKAAQEDLRNPYAAIAAAIELMPMQFILTDSYVATVEESTTVIPSTIVVEPTGREYYSISSIPQYVMEVLEAYAGDALDAPRIAQFLGKTPAENPEETGEETVKIPEGGTKEYNVSATAGTGFKAWVEQPAARAGASEFKLSVNNDSAEAVDGVLHFTGSGILSVTAESGAGGVLCIEADDGTVKRCPIEVVEAHECGSEDWVTAAEPSGQESGLRVKYCDVCGEIIDMQEMELCDSHEFSPYYETESPDLTSSGVKKRVCVHCGCTQYVYTDAYALNGYVYAFPEGTSIREAEEFFGSRGIQAVFAEPGETQAATGTGFSSGGRNYQIVITGDVNGDAEVNMFDTFEITDHIKGEKTLTGASLEAGLADIYRSEPELFDLAEIVSQVTESTDQP